MELTVRVKPGSRRGPLVETAAPDEPDASLVVHVRERAVDGAANRGVVEAIASHLGVPRGRVEIVGGATARITRIRVEGADVTP